MKLVQETRTFVLRLVRFTEQVPRGYNESVLVLLHAVTIVFCDEPYLDIGASAQQQTTDHGRVRGYTAFATFKPFRLNLRFRA